VKWAANMFVRPNKKRYVEAKKDKASARQEQSCRSAARAVTCQ